MAARDVARSRVVPVGATPARSLFAVLVAAALAACGNPSAAPSGSSTQAAQATPSPGTSPSAIVSLVPTATPSPTFGPTGSTQEAQVTRVVDGDTIEVEIAGALHKVRYIGIDTPETVDPKSPVQWMGPEASAANAALVGGRVVYLERDVSETDRYGRLLRYVWLSEPTGWLFVNLELVRSGFAAVSTYPPDVRYEKLFLAAQREARDAQAGLWGPTPPPAEEPTAVPTGAPTPKPTTSANCDPSYPTVCIAPYPPDLDCADVPYRNFVVLQPDPHRFDGDKDGIGCET